MHACSAVSNNCDPMDYSPPCFSVQGIVQARVLEWVAIAFSKIKREASLGAPKLRKA